MRRELKGSEALASADSHMLANLMRRELKVGLEGNTFEVKDELNLMRRELKGRPCSCHRPPRRGRIS